MIGIAESALLGAAILLYIIPLIGLFIGAWLVSVTYAESNELAVFIGGVTGFMVSWMVIRHAARNRQWARLFQPVVVQTLAEEEPCLMNRGAEQ